MSCPIKNRCFNSPITSTFADPKNWTVTNSATDWGAGKGWASGVYQAMGGGPLPRFASHCLMLGPGDVQTSTAAGKDLASGEQTEVKQLVAGNAMVDVEQIKIDYVVMDKGAVAADTRIVLEVTIGAAVTATAVIVDTATVAAVGTLALNVAALSTSTDWQIGVRLHIDANSAGGAKVIPRVYIDNLRCHYRPYRGPMRVIGPAQDSVVGKTAFGVSGGTTETGFLTTSVANQRGSSLWVSSTDTSFTFLLDFATTQSFSCSMICNHNFVAGDLVQLRAGAASPPTNVIATFRVSSQESTFVEFAQSTAYRYWGIYVSGSNKNWALGEWILGNAIHLQHNVRWGPSLSRSYNSNQLVTPYGNAWHYFRSQRRAYAMEWSPMSEADAAQLRLILDDAKGNVYPVAIIPDPSKAECFYGHFDASHSSAHSFVQVEQPGRMEFVEQIRALVQT